MACSKQAGLLNNLAYFESLKANEGRKKANEGRKKAAICREITPYFFSLKYL